MELEVRMLRNDRERRVVMVDLSSATKDGYRVYWLETGDTLLTMFYNLVGLISAPALMLHL